MEENTLINQLRLGVPEAFEEIYRLHFKKIHAYISRNSGTLDDAKDYFQEAIIVLVQNIRKKEFKLTSDSGTYLYSTARNKWLNHLKRRKIMVSTEDNENMLALQSEESEIAEKKIYDKKAHLAYEVLKQIGENCQQLLEYIFFEKLSHEEIAKKMGYASGSIRVTKFRCLEAYRKKMGNHPKFNQIFE